MRKLLLSFLILISLISSSASLNGASAGKDTICSGTISPNNINQIVQESQSFTTSGSTNFTYSDSIHYEAWFESLGQFGPSKWAWPATVGSDGQLSFTLDPATSRPKMGADRSLTGGGIISIYRTDMLSEDQKICYFSLTINQSGTQAGGDGTFNVPNKLPCKSDTDCNFIQTAFGPISTSPQGFIRWLLGFILSLSGGIVLLVIIATGYRLMTSQGDPEKVKAAREQLTAAVVGLLFIIFSLVILQAITIDILHIPGFNK